MKLAAGRVATFSFLMLAAQPCYSADDIRDIGNPHRVSAAFAGANVSLALGRGGHPRPAARLQLGVTHTYPDTRSAAPTQMHRFSGFELGASTNGEPIFYLGGQDVRNVEQRLGVKGSTGTVLIVGGVLVALVVVALMSSGGQLSPCTGGPGC